MRLERVLRQHQTAGSIRLEVGGGLKSTIASAAVLFVAKNASDELVFDDGPATADDVVDAADGTKGATFDFPLTATSTLAPGVFHGHFRVTYPDGSVDFFPKLDALVYRVTADYAALDETPEALSTAGFLQSQAAHGFAVGEAVYLGGSGWALARANDPATLAAAIVLAVPDANSFRVAYLAGQEVTLAAHGKGAAGTDLYLSADTEGLVTASAPAADPDNLIQRLGRVKDANTWILWPHAAEPAA